MFRRHLPVPGQIPIDWTIISRPELVTQREMIVRAQNGDARSMAKLCADHEAYARRLCGAWRGSRDMDDVYQQARLGIVNAVMSYNPDKQTRLITHVHWQIMRELKSEARRRDRAGKEIPKACIGTF